MSLPICGLVISLHATGGQIPSSMRDLQHTLSTSARGMYDQPNCFKFLLIPFCRSSQPGKWKSNLFWKRYSQHWSVMHLPRRLPCLHRRLLLPKSVTDLRRFPIAKVSETPKKLSLDLAILPRK